MERKPLPSGGWVDIEDPKVLRALAKRRVYAGINDKMSDGEQMLNAFDTLAGLMIVAWEVPGMPGHPDPAQVPLPRNQPNILEQLSADDYTAIEELVMPAVHVVMGRKPTPDQHDDPASPSEPANA